MGYDLFLTFSSSVVIVVASAAVVATAALVCQVGIAQTNCTVMTARCVQHQHNVGWKGPSPNVLEVVYP